MLRSFSCFAVVLGACGAGSADPSACASGVRADGQCLHPSSPSSGASGAGGGAPFGNELGAPCDHPRALVCGHPDGDPASDSVLVCDGGVYAKLLSCGAPSACAELVGHTSVHCGPPEQPIPYAIEGDPCVPELAAACPVDRGRLLVCSSGAWVGAKSCVAGQSCQRTTAGTQGAGWSCPASSVSGCVVCE
jgi:hypothetical protein